MATPIIIPLVNPNEPESLLASVHVNEGDKVCSGDLIAVLETTKSTFDLLAETDGYIIGLSFNAGDNVASGAIFAYIADSPDWIPPAPAAQDPSSQAPPGTPADLRITKPALNKAEDLGIDLNTLPHDQLITVNFLENFITTLDVSDESAEIKPFDPSKILVYGGGGHGKSVIDVIRAMGTFSIHGVIDDSLTPGDTILSVPILGGRNTLPELYAQGIRQIVNAVGGIGNVNIRKLVFQHIAAARMTCPGIVHLSAVIESSANLAFGTQVFPLAYIGSSSSVGFGTIINTGAIVSHDCVIGDYVNISPGAILAGAVTIHNEVLIGMGVTVNLGVTIGAGAKIGNNATIKSDVPKGIIIKAGAIWPLL